jgi:hypothetical protein
MPLSFTGQWNIMSGNRPFWIVENTDTEFRFGAVHPVTRALSRLSGKTILRNNCSRRLFYFIPRLLHVSAFTGHHQAEHTICKEVIILTTDLLSVV